MDNSQGLHWLKQTLRYGYAGVISASLWAVPLAIAGLASYQPPNGGSSPNGQAGSMGTRSGCVDNATAPLTALAPQQHVGQTISTHPTFFWYMPDMSTATVEFTLYRMGEAAEFVAVKQATLERVTGLMSYTLPTTEPALAEGQQYRWEVRVLCSAGRASSALSTGAFVERVPALATADAEQLAEAGIWYDALAIALTHNASPYWLELLDSLAQVEPPSANAAFLSQRDRLLRVIEHER